MMGPDDISATREEASDWFVRLQSDAASESDWLAFEVWLAASPDNASAYAVVENLWLALDDQAAEIAPHLPPAIVQLDLRRAARIKVPSRRHWIAGAVAASLAVVVGGVVYRADPFAPAEVYQTARGETRTVLLKDGSQIFLNGGSLLKVRLTRHERRVELADAQAVFDVAKDPDRPFLIAAGDREVRVVGTRFDLVRHTGRLRVTVARGVVEVRPSASPDGAPVRLTRGQQLEHQEGRSDNAVRTVDPDMVLAWQARRLIYHNESLDQVAADLSRAFAQPVTTTQAVAKLRFSGILQLDNEDAVLARLQAFAPIEVQHGDGTVVLTASGRAG